MSNGLLMVIPSTIRFFELRCEIDEDYANNLREYLRSFSTVTFACPVSTKKTFDIARSIPMTKIEGYNRLTFIPLPYPYREDRYLKYYLSVRAKLSSEIARSDFLLFSPHAKYDWSTLAANLAISQSRKFGIECDYDYRNVGSFHLSSMRPGLRKLRKVWWAKSFYDAADRCLKHSAIALLQGQEVFDGLKHLAANPQKVLNVQVTSDDLISENELGRKIHSITGSRSLQIIYAGRMAAMKGPLDWLNALKGAIELGVDVKATWLGEGPMLSEMSNEIRRLGLQKNVELPGLVPRDELMRRLKYSDMFLFCHKTGELPRCLGEALVSGAPLVGYGTGYPRDLVAEHGGGEFAETGDWRALAQIIADLGKDRRRLATLVESAAKSGACLNRDAAIRQQIDLIRTYLGR